MSCPLSAMSTLQPEANVAQYACATEAFAISGICSSRNSISSSLTMSPLLLFEAEGTIKMICYPTLMCSYFFIFPKKIFALNFMENPVFFDSCVDYKQYKKEKEQKELEVVKSD